MRFTAENAAEYAKKSHEPDSARFLRLLTPAEEAQITSPFQKQRLSRVRAQLNRLDRMMMEETDPSKLDRIASAQARLSEQERLLAGRPSPGSLRPSAKAGRAKQTYSAPTPEVDEVGPENG